MWNRALHLLLPAALTRLLLVARGVGAFVHDPAFGVATVRPSTTTTTRSSAATAVVALRAAPRDMSYLPHNIMRQMEQYRAIRAAGGVETANDVYVRDSSEENVDNVFWFAGKIARCTGTVSIDQAVSRQWNLITEHAARLRPIELASKFNKGLLEVWTAPPDTELDVAYNRPHVLFEKRTLLSPDDHCAYDVRSVEVGFEGELYEEGEEGFRTVRTEDGRPARPEIKEPSSQ